MPQPTLFPVDEILPTMLTKKELRCHLGKRVAGRLTPIAHKTLKAMLKRDGILKEAGVKWKAIRFAQYLPPHVTLIIIRKYNITKI